ncbi:MarR family winged helix-turn-helix transcriptional regulator [Hydrogenophaga sp.]|jgi:DNA-binding MarR family transcriptional regulator|uniref:MarR family winged helix-turn-helix transcriptional regulator n=1 Tax=Hydrogenophaga sp. TaxID=1904254 RepID=UPI00391873AC
MPDDRLAHPRQQADLLLYRLYRLHTTAGRQIVQMCEGEFGMTRREWRVLSFVAEHEGVASSELAQHAMLDRARTSRTLTLLAEKKLIERRPKPSDRREVHMHLTEEGRRVYAAIAPRVAAYNSAMVDGLSLAERQQLDAVLDALQARAERLAPP